MALISASIRAVVDYHFCNEPLDVRFKWRSALAEAVEDRRGAVGSDSKPIQSPTMCLLMKKLNEHLHDAIRREAKREPQPIYVRPEPQGAIRKIGPMMRNHD